MVSCDDHRVGRWWKHFILILTPLVLLLPLLLIPEETLPYQANQCLYVMLLMAVYWVTEAFSLYVTSCLPIFIFPALGILTSKEVADQFLTAVVIMFLGGMMVAFAVEKCNLHKRIAIGVLHLMGTKPLWLMLGFMLPSGILSMWISNTATTAMMLPISEAVLDSLYSTYDKRRKKNAEQTTKVNETELNGEVNEGFHSDVELGVQEKTSVPDDHTTEGFAPVKLKGSMAQHPDLNIASSNSFIVTDVETDDNDGNTREETHHSATKTTGNAKLDKFARGMTLAICYSANIGGTATIVGTPPNAIMQGQADLIWQANGYEESTVTFASWLTVAMPIALINLVFLWLWLTVYHNGIRSLIPCCVKLSEDDAAIKEVIDEEYRSLGRIRFAEIAVSIAFLGMLLLWFFRSPSFIVGWSDLDTFKPGYTHDAVVSIFITVVLCAIPSKLPTCRKNDTGPVDNLLDWDTINRKMPWGIIFLVGGGFCVAQASTKSGLSAWIADGLLAMSSWPGWVMIFVICLITATMTEITSNSATCTILMPIVGSLAEKSGYNPLYLMIPVALSSSFAFMLPSATPPNALAFSYGRLKIFDMVKGGFIMNIICVAVVTVGTQTWGTSLFNLDEIPWAVNTTTTATTLV